MKSIALLAGAMLALFVGGCATHDSAYIPYPTVMAAESDCSHTRKMAGQRCHVLLEFCQQLGTTGMIGREV